MELTQNRTIFEPRTAAGKTAAVVLGAAFIAALSQLRVPLWFTDVPVTLQVLAVLLAGFALGPKLGAMSVMTYLAAGAAGLPVLSGWNGGLSYLFESYGYVTAPTLGFLIGFPIAAQLSGSIWQDRKETSFRYALMTGILGVLFIYLGGFCWQAVQLASRMGLVQGVSAAFIKTVLPFILIDAAKAAIAAIMVVKTHKAISGV